MLHQVATIGIERMKGYLVSIPLNGKRSRVGSAVVGREGLKSPGAFAAP